MKHVERLSEILRFDRVYILNTDFRDTVLYADDGFAYVAVDNTTYESTFAIEGLRLIGH